MHRSGISESPVKLAQFFAMSREEPFRIFFPIGLASGVVGLALWPLFFGNVLSIYPAQMHARVMIEGFMAAFIIGFLGTAGPRLMTARHFGSVEVCVLIALHLATIAAHLAAHPTLGDALFFVQIATLTGVLGRRFIARSDLPPPNFVLVACGLLSGAVGAGIAALTSIFGDWPRLNYFGALALSQGFVLLPVLGVGAFLFPRFLGVPLGPELDELRVPIPWWKRKAILSGCAGVAIVVSFAVESAGFLRASGALRWSALLYIRIGATTVSH